MTHSPTSAREWELRHILACEEAAACLRDGRIERAAEWTRLAIVTQEVARLKRIDELKHSPPCALPA